MPDEETTIHALKTASDGTVKISVEKYNELLEKVAEQKSSIWKLNDLLTKARNEPPVIHRTNVIKTAEMVTKENLLWGNTFMGVGAALFVVGILRRKSG
jgi:hypothetical protein